MLEEEERSKASRVYTSEIYNKAVVNGYHKLWKNGILYDTELFVGDRSFQVHRSLLAAGSWFFPSHVYN